MKNKLLDDMLISKKKPNVTDDTTLYAEDPEVGMSHRVWQMIFLFTPMLIRNAANFSISFIFFKSVSTFLKFSLLGESKHICLIIIYFRFGAR